MWMDPQAPCSGTGPGTLTPTLASMWTITHAAA